MAIHFTTSNAEALLKAFDERISQKEAKDKITTWEKSSDKKYYTHKAPEWNKKAWFLPKVEANQLTFNIIKPSTTNINNVVYAYYHGHLIETFLSHFDEMFKNGFASALPEPGDNVNS
ncbi:MAG: hypothetical protein LCH54_17425 [Bacteroidetes bacterium]|nr:hypothetical protein [Bacteroidota bacterium]